jgi:hypothetical protein
LLHFVENKVRIERNKAGLSKCGLTKLWSKRTAGEGVEVVKEVGLSNFIRAEKDLFTDAFLKFVLEFLENANIKRLDEMCRVWWELE